MQSVIFRRAVATDYAAIVQLNAANYIANLSKEDLRDGFLSAAVYHGADRGHG